MAGVFVQDNAAWDDSGDSVASFQCAYSSDVTNGNLLYAVGSFSVNQTPTIADSRGSTWTLIGVTWNAGEEVGVARWWALANGTGPNTVTVSYPSNSQSSKIYVHEAAGLASVSPLDGTGSAAGGFFGIETDALSSGAFTTSQADSYVISAALCTSSVTLTEGTGFTRRYSGAVNRVGGETRVVAAGSVAGTWTLSSGSVAVVAADAFKAAASGSFSLTAESGSYALTGQDVSLLAGRLVTAQQGAYSVTGQEVSFIAGGRLIADAGSYTLLGSAALVDNSLTASQGSYALTGQEAGITATRVLQAEQGSYSLSGMAAALRYSAEVIVRKLRQLRRMFGFRLSR